MQLRGMGELQTRVQGQHEQSRAVSAVQHGPACAPPRSVSTAAPLQLPLLHPVAALPWLSPPTCSCTGFCCTSMAGPGAALLADPRWSCNVQSPVNVQQVHRG